MKNSRFVVSVVVRVALLSINCFILIWFYTQTSRPATTIFFFILLIIQSLGLIRFVTRINRDLANFLVYLQENDTTLAFTSSRIERSFKGLTWHLDQVNQKLRQARLDRELHYQYLHAIVEHVNVGMMVLDQKGDVRIINRMAKELLGLKTVKEINDLLYKYPELTSLFCQQKGNPNPLIKIKANNKECMLAFKLRTLKLAGDIMQLISFQDISSELEAQELDSWRKLIRILRHEIMNTMTPVTTLTTAIKRGFSNGNKRKSMKDITAENIDDTLASTEVIEERSKGLIDFVERFKSLADPPVPKCTRVFVKDMAERIGILFSGEFASKSISYSLQIEDDALAVFADESLLEMVLINLLKNSIHAIQYPGGIIQIKAYRLPAGIAVIQVIDNGIGIKPENLESVFVPAYTTRLDGSGIGLSISRQIIRLHNGNLTVSSDPGKETIFEIRLNVP
jgi:nitrogen fixation/metabolism regulation signal transduction histidine kinase